MSHDHPSHPQPYNEEIKGDSCMPDFNVLATPADWRPLAPDEYGVKFIVASNVNQSKHTANAVMHAQSYMKKQFASELSDTKLFMDVETFQDGCRHATGWSVEPRDIAAKSTRWHCHQTNTKFHEAFAELKDVKRKVNVLFIIGDRFDDDLQKTLKVAKELKEIHGTRIFALPLTTNHTVQEAYKRLSVATEGLCLSELSVGAGAQSVDRLIEEIVQAVISEEANIELPPPANDQLGQVREKILMLKQG